MKRTTCAHSERVWEARYCSRLFPRFRRTPLPAFALALLIQAGWLPAQRYNFSHYRNADGLPQTQVLSLYQDSTGYIWFGTYGGVARYDGSEFLVLDTQDGLSENTVRAIAQDAQGRLLFGTRGGVSVYDGLKFVSWKAPDKLPNDSVTGFHLDRDGSIWVATEGGLAHVSEDDAIHFATADGLPDSTLNTIMRDSQQRLWVGTRRGLARLDGQRFHHVSAGIPPDVDVSAILEDPEGRLWVGTEQGLYNGDGETFAPAALASPPDLGTLSFTAAVSRGGVLWFGTRSGLVRIIGSQAKIFGQSEGLLTTHVYALLMDREGTLWIGADGGGTKLVRGPFVTYTRNHGLPDDFVRDIAEDRHGNIWLGTRKGVGVIEPDGTISRLGKADGIGEARTYAVTPLADDSVLIGTNRGLFHWSQGRPRSYDARHGLPSVQVRSLLSDPDGGAWIGLGGGSGARGRGGLLRWRAGSLTRPPGTDRLSYTDIMALERDSLGRIWVGTAHSGVFVYHGGRLIRPADDLTLRSVTIWTLEPDRKGGMWIGTNGQGAFRIAPEGITRLSVDQGLSNNYIWQLLVDRDDDVWVYTNRGLYRWDGQRLRRFDVSDGLPDLEGAAGAALQDSGGNLWFGTGKGVTRFMSEHDVRPAVRPRAVIQSVGERPLAFLGQEQPARLPPQKNLSFTFAGLTFRHETDTYFRYRLLGLDPKWSESTHERQISYANLPSGDYTFEVTATARAGRLSQPARFRFTIEPRLSETLWFRVLALLMVVLWVGSLYWMRNRHVEKERRRLAKIVQARTRELAQQRDEREAAEASSRAKSEFLAMMSHEIRTPINGILGMTELMLNTSMTESQRRYCQTAHGAGANLLQIIDDILDYSKIEEGKLDLEHSEFDLSDKIQQTVQILAQLAEEKGLELICDIGLDVPTALKGDPNRLGQVLLNLISNAIKFTDEGEIVLTVSLVEESDGDALLRFEVRDTGIGISPEAQERVFERFSQADFSTTRKYGGTGLGLAISKRLTVAMGGEIGVDSRAGNGSTFWFTARIDKQEGVGESPLSYEALEGHRILIVDDARTNRELLRRYAQCWGMRCETVRDAGEALASLRQAARSRDPFEFALLDLNMPDLDGLSLAGAICQDPVVSSVRMILLSSVGASPDTAEARAVGISACLNKPVRQSSLLEALLATVPTAAGDAQSASLQETKPMHDQRLDGRILLVEDNLTNQAVAIAMLQEFGCAIEAAASGEEALKAVADHQFDVVLMDVEMPGMDGFETARRIREMENSQGAAQLPIIAVTANALPGYRERCLEAGMSDYLSKPYGMAELRDMLKRWLLKGPHNGRPGNQSPTAARPAPSGANGRDSSAESPVDDATLERIRNLQPNGKSDLVDRLVSTYVSESSELLDTLKAAVEEDDSEATRFAAHTLKSSSGNVGALRLAQLCEDLEHNGRSARPSREVLAQIEAEFQRVVRALQERIA